METPSQYREKAFGQTTRTQQTNVYSGGSSGMKAYQEATANASPGESPEEYRRRADAEKAAQASTPTPTTQPTQQQVDALKARYQPAGGLMESFIEQQKASSTAPASSSPRQITQGQLSQVKAGVPGAAMSPYTEIPGQEVTAESRSGLNMDNIISGYDYAQRKISGRIPTLDAVQEAGARYRERNPATADMLYNAMDDIAGVAKNTIPKEYGVAIGERTVNQYNEFQQQPIDKAIDVGVLAGTLWAGNAALKVGSVGARAGLGKAAGIVGTGSAGAKIASGGLKLTANAIDPAIAVVGTGLVVNEFKNATPAEQVDLAGALLIGGVASIQGWRAGDKIVGAFQTRGRTFIPLETLTDPAVASGKQAYPYTRPGQTPDALVAEFKSNNYGLPNDIAVPGKYGAWHGTPQKLPSTVEIANNPKRPTDVGGLYISPRFSPAFTRVSRIELSILKLVNKSLGKAESNILEGNWKGAAGNIGKAAEAGWQGIVGAPAPVRPSVVRVYVDDITRLPPESRTLQAGKDFLSSESKPGKAYLTPDADALAVTGRVESEAVLSPRTILRELDSQYYTKIGGRRVPIDRFETVHTPEAPKDPLITKGKIRMFEDVVSSGSGRSPHSSIAPKFPGISAIIGGESEYKPPAVSEWVIPSPSRRAIPSPFSDTILPSERLRPDPSPGGSDWVPPGGSDWIRPAISDRIVPPPGIEEIMPRGGGKRIPLFKPEGKRKSRKGDIDPVDWIHGTRYNAWGKLDDIIWGR